MINSVDDAITAFADAHDAPPNDAMQWALDHWDQAAPRFIDMLTAYASGADQSDTTTDALFFIIHLCGDRGETRAYRPLCQLMLNEDRLILTLGDQAAVETLKGILIKCFDGDVKPLQNVIESEAAESITRGEAMLALAWLTRTGRWREPAMRDYIRHLLLRLKPREEDYIWFNLIVTTAILGYKEFAAEATKLIKDGLVPEEWLTLAELPELLSVGDPTGMDGLKAEEIAPFDNVIEALADWPWPEPEDEEDAAVQEPYINPLRHVGRNDPCPCGSGKKFKNCHLVDQ